MTKETFNPRCFLTGSRIYGTPTEDSDVDLVLLVTPEVKQQLIDWSDLGRMPVRFGKLNLILVTDRNEYIAWLGASIECIESAPVTREQAVEIHKEFGVKGSRASKTRAEVFAND